MGIIEQVHANANWYGSSRNAAMYEGIDVAMAGIQDVLKQPEFIGDVDTALMHHLGRDAFADYDFWPAHGVLKLADIIAYEDTETAPVVLTYQKKIGADTDDNVETALMIVNPNNLEFSSRTVHERNVQLPGFAGKVAVTNRTLSIAGVEPIVAEGDIFLPGVYGGQYDVHYEDFTLSQTRTVDPKNRAKPVDVSYGDSEAVKMRTFHIESDLVLGWEELANKLGRCFTQEEASPKYIHDIRALLARKAIISQIREVNPRVGKLLTAADKLQRSLESVRDAYAS